MRSGLGVVDSEFIDPASNRRKITPIELPSSSSPITESAANKEDANLQAEPRERTSAVADSGNQPPLVHRFDAVPDQVHALRQFSSLQHCLFLESSRQTTTASGKQLGRYSFLMADPVEWVECSEVADCAAALRRLDGIQEKFQSNSVPDLPPMQGGLAGLISYDLNRAFEAIPAPKNDDFQTPLIAMGLYDVVLAWDHATDEAFLFCQSWGNATGRQELFLDLLAADSGSVTQQFEGTSIELDGMQFPVEGPEGLVSNFSKEGYLEAVEQSIEYIYAGDIFQVNLSQRLAMPQNCSSLDLYERLRQRNSSPFGGYFDYGSGQIVSASPERLVSVRDGVIETRPIKGTRSRTGQPMVDINASRKLEASEKDRAENTMIVDLMRNDLSRICTDESVRVTQLCEIEQYQSVIHLVSAVEGILTDGRCSVSELLRAIFPGGSVTGAPKVRAMEIIAELEPDARGAYCGSLGYFSSGGSVDLNILIRTITASKGWWQIPVGGGIVSQSNPRSEYGETWTKAAGMLNAAKIADSPRKGIHSK